MYNKMFDLDQDGKPDAVESALEYMYFCDVTGEDEPDNDTFDFEEDSEDEEDDF